MRLTEQNFIVEHNPALCSVLNTYREVDHKGAMYMVIPRTNLHASALKAMGYDVPDDGRLATYDWMGTTPFESQRVTVNMMVNNPRGYVLNGLGTGKTRSVLYAYDYLRRQGEVEKLLVLGKLSTLSAVWETEVLDTCPHYKTVVLHGTKSKRLKLLATEADIYIANHEAVGVIGKELAQFGFDMVAVDEGSVLRNQRTDKWKKTKPIVDSAKFAYPLTGTPTPNEPSEAYGLAKMFTPDRVPRFFKQFKSDTMVQVSQFTWIPRDTANAVVHQALQPSVRFKLEDCVDMPPVIRGVRRVEMGANAKKAYADMYKEQVVEFQNGHITAINAGVKLSKLLQISGGFIYDTKTGEAVDLTEDVDTRCEVVKEFVSEAEGKVLLFAPFTALVERVASYFDTDMVVHGQVNKTKRDEIFMRFKHNAEDKMIVAHPATMSHGLNLIEANVVILVFSYHVLGDIRTGQRSRTTTGADAHTVHSSH